MSGVTYWLQKQRKGELVDLARYLGMKKYVVSRNPTLYVFGRLMEII